MTKCPNCGQELNVNLTKAGGSNWSNPGQGWKPLSDMQSSAPWQPDRTGPGRLEQAAAMGAHLSAYRKTPARSAEVGSDVLVPILKGCALGVAAGLLAIIPTILTPAWPWWSPAVVVLVVSPAAVISWLFYHQQLLWNIERVDAEPPEAPPAPMTTPPPVALEITHKTEDNQFLNMFRFDLPNGISEQAFYDFAQGITTGGKGLAQSDWTGNGKPFSQPKYRELLSRLSEAGIIAFVDPDAPTVGRKLTRKGNEALQRFVYAYQAAQYPPDNQAGRYVHIDT